MNFNDLQSDLVKAEEADKRYAMENDAKFRAVEQKVENYGQFLAIVKGCHLKPLKKDEAIGKLSNSVPAWNNCAKPESAHSTELASQVQKYFK